MEEKLQTEKKNEEPRDCQTETNPSRAQQQHNTEASCLAQNVTAGNNGPSVEKAGIKSDYFAPEAE